MDPNTNQSKPTETFVDESLESPSAEITSGDSQSPSAGPQTTSALDASSQPDSTPPSTQSPLHKLLQRVNGYLVAFIGLLIVAGLIVALILTTNQRSTSSSVQTQALTKQALQQLADSDVSVGQPKQVLNVQSNAVFAGQVLVRSGLDVAGKLQVGSGLDLPDLTVSGNSQLSAVQVQKDLAVAGNAALQGQLSVQKNLNVAGGANFGGAVSVPQLTTGSLQLSDDLAINHHIVTGGPTPGRSGGSALGSGGSASVSGSDTAGTINVNTGSNTSAGCFISVNFTAKYNATPHVLVTPVGSAAGSVGYYITRSNTGFSVCASNTPPSGTNFGFDYFVAG